MQPTSRNRLFQSLANCADVYQDHKFLTNKMEIATDIST